ncbi:MAG: M12 family metallopeptidase [Chthoniobacterales bacterium]
MSIPLIRVILQRIVVLLFLVPLATGWAQIKSSTASASLAAYNQILQKTTSDDDLVSLGDMQVRAGVIRNWRDHLAGTSTTSKGGVSTFSATPSSAGPSGLVKWPGGIVYYAFASGVTAAHQRAFRDAAAEWTTFANVQFTPRTTQTNYMWVENAAISGGQSAVGMVGPAQTFLIGSWNRGTLLHEIGHTLGLIHEHQRSDRDTYVNILTSNINGGASNGNFTLIPSSLNNGPYDFYSIMHYARNAFSINPATLNTIEPKPAYSAYLDIYGQQYDRPLSPGDRAGMAILYGAATALSPIVTNTRDSGPGSLRAALYYGFDHPGTTITFNIPTTDPGYAGHVFAIRPSAPLFAPGDNTTIDGTLAGGDTNPYGPSIVLTGTYAQPPDVYAPGLKLVSANCTIRHLVIYGFSQEGILITGAAAQANKIVGCYIGLSWNGTTAAPNAFDGITLSGGAINNSIGGTTAADRNVISGNTASGIYITGSGTSGNRVLGNYIGTKYSGVTALANRYAGITIAAGASGNTVGGTTSTARNVICGNTQQGIVIADPGTTGNIVSGNFIGLNNTGLTSVPNGYAGVQISDGASGNLIGGTTSASRNVISGNASQGVSISGVGTNQNTIAANYIGLNSTGSAARANAFSGVGIYGGAQNNTVGGTVSGSRNYISGNAGQGIAIDGTGSSGNVVAGNYIGLSPAGTVAIPNNVGIDISGAATANTIGGISAASRNYISGNNYRGIGIYGAGTNGNTVSANYIGLNGPGTAASANVGPGVALFGGTQGNLIGGTVSGARNFISGNQQQGITISGTGTNSNSITYNYIGLNPAGTSALPNGWSGVDIFGEAQANVIGNIGTPNIISGNGNYGVSLSGAGTSNNSILNNTIGLNAGSTAAIGNMWSGIALFSGATGNLIGGLNSGQGNLISGNNLRGIDLFDATTFGNRIQRNAIYGNAQLAINLAAGSEDGFGVTANDIGDTDTGPNTLQNFPILTSVLVSSTRTTLTGTLNSQPNQSYRIEFFHGPAGDASQHGGCRYFLGYTNVATNGSGNGSFSVYFTSPIPIGNSVSATATSSSNNTSEFAGNIVATGAP